MQRAIDLQDGERPSRLASSRSALRFQSPATINTPELSSPSSSVVSASARITSISVKPRLRAAGGVVLGLTGVTAGDLLRQVQLNPADPVDYFIAIAVNNLVSL